MTVDGVHCGPDGMRADVYGNLWCSSNAPLGYAGVLVYNAQAKLIGRIRLPEVCANLAFGGPKRDHLLMLREPVDLPAAGADAGRRAGVASRGCRDVTAWRGGRWSDRRGLHGAAPSLAASSRTRAGGAAVPECPGRSRNATPDPCAARRGAAP